MAYMTVRDNAVWAKHIEGDPRLVERILALPENAPVTLLIDAKPVGFLKMRDGADGRSTPGLRPDPAFKPFWNAMQDRRGEVVSVELDQIEAPADLHLASTFFPEWNSVEDAEAYDRL